MDSAPPAAVRRSAHSPRAREARARLFRGAAVAMIGVVAFMAFTMRQRNRQAIALREQSIRTDFLAPLKAEVLRLEGRLPLEFPGPRTANAQEIESYYYPDADSVWLLQKADFPIIVGHSGRVTSFFQTNGYFTVVVDLAGLAACRDAPAELAACLDDCIRVRWIEEGAFCGRIQAQHDWLNEQEALAGAKGR